MYELISQAQIDPCYSDGMWNRLAMTRPYSDLSLTNDRMKRWHGEPVALRRLQGYARRPSLMI